MFRAMLTRTTNPVSFWLIILAVVVSLTALGMVIFTLFPQSMGTPFQPMSAESAFLFDEWYIHTTHGLLSFPDGGSAVEVFQYGRLSALMVHAQGSFSLLRSSTEAMGDDFADDCEPQEEVPLVAFESVLIMLPPAELSAARGSTYIQSVIMPDAVYSTNQLLAQENTYLPTLTVLGNKRYLPLRPGTARILFFDGGTSSLYTEGIVTSFQGQDESLRFIDTSTLSLFPPYDLALLASLGNFLFVALLLVAAYFATLGETQTNKLRVPAQQAKIWIGITLVFILAQGLAARLGLSPIVQVTAHLLLAATVAYYLGVFKLERLFDNWSSGIILGLGLGLLGSVLGATGLPIGLRIDTAPEAVLRLIYGLFWIGLVQETLWRGLIQNSLISRWGLLRGLAGTALLAGCFSLMTGALTSSNPLFLIEALLTVPLQALLLGFVYYRNGTVTAPALMAAILYLMPQFFLF